MAISACINGLATTALVALLIVPAPYIYRYVPGFYEGSKEPKLDSRPLSTHIPEDVEKSWFTLDLPPFDLFLMITFLLMATITYVCEWIQRKLLERRMLKLNHYLSECVDRLKLWDERQEKLETTLQMVQNSTSEYNLLLYLLLRQRRLGKEGDQLKR